MTTKKLFWDDPYQIRFDAKILQIMPAALPPVSPENIPEDARQIALDQTAFYPEGGGQPCDLGTLHSLPVLYVFEEQGIVWHIVANEPGLTLLYPTSSVRGIVDWSRRFDHMQQHLGQHLLSAVFEKIHHANTIGFHLGEQHITIDLDKGPFTQDQLTTVENKTNDFIFDNRPVRATFVSEQTYHSLALRKTPDIRDEVRLVEIDDVDLCACSGTHPHGTGSVGMVKIIKSETYKGGCRITFLCGLRALNTWQRMHQVITEVSASLSVGWPELSTAVHALQQNQKSVTKDFKELMAQWAQLECNQLLSEAQVINGVSLVMYYRDSVDYTQLTYLANAFREKEQCVVLLGVSHPSPRFILLNTTGHPALSMQQLLKKSIHLINGKGGGNAASAQGGGSVPEGLEPMLLTIREEVRQLLLS